MPIKNGRYKDSKGRVRHFETNENMVVVDDGKKTLKQKLTEILANIQEAVSSKVDAIFVKDITGDKTKLQTIDKTNLVNAINELKRTGGGGSGVALNVFKRTGGTWGEFIATEPTTTFDVPNFDGATKVLDVYYLGMPLVPEKHFTVSSVGAVTLGFELAIGEIIDYCVSDVSFNYDELANKPIQKNIESTAMIAPLDPNYDTPTQPTDYSSNSLSIAKLKETKAMGLDSPTEKGYWSNVMAISGHGGGGIVEVAYTSSGNSYFRRGNQTDNTWENWKQIATSDHLNGIKIYTDFSQVKVGYNVNTPLLELVGSMQNNSKLIVHVSGGGSQYPYGWGLLEITKVAYQRDEIRYTPAYTVSKNEVFVCRTYQNSGVNTLSPWSKIATSDRINNLTFVNGWTLKKTMDSDTFTLSKTGNIVCMNFKIINSSTTLDWSKITTLPVGYRPKNHIAFQINSTHNVICYPNGEVQFDKATTSANITYSINICFESE